MSGDPIWTKCWHQFTSVKKGQSFRCRAVKTEKVKVGGKWVRKTQWERHQKRFMCFKMKTFREKVIAWGVYLEWRSFYLARNPALPITWHVSESRLNKERCFCVDPEERVRKCGCEIHLKMSELTAGLKRWRQRTLVLIGKTDHTCMVWYILFSVCMMELILLMLWNSLIDSLIAGLYKFWVHLSLWKRQHIP